MIVIKAQEYRSQELNREAALARLVAVIKDLTTEQKPEDLRGPCASKERRLASKAQKIKREGDARQSAQRSGVKKKEWMVKKAIVTAMAVISLFTLMGCNNRAEVDTLSRRRPQELKPMP